MIPKGSLENRSQIRGRKPLKFKKIVSLSKTRLNQSSMNSSKKISARSNDRTKSGRRVKQTETLHYFKSVLENLKESYRADLEEKRERSQSN